VSKNAGIAGDLIKKSVKLTIQIIPIVVMIIATRGKGKKL